MGPLETHEEGGVRKQKKGRGGRWEQNKPGKTAVDLWSNEAQRRETQREAASPESVDITSSCRCFAAVLSKAVGPCTSGTSTSAWGAAVAKRSNAAAGAIFLVPAAAAPA